MADASPNVPPRDHARGLLLAYASSGTPISVRLRDKLWHAAEPDDDFRRDLDAHHRAREAREQRHDANLEVLRRKLAEAEAAAREAGRDPTDG